MRQGDSAEEACNFAITRLRQNCPEESASPKMHKKLTVGVAALSVKGDAGASSTLGPHNPHRGHTVIPNTLP